MELCIGRCLDGVDDWRRECPVLLDAKEAVDGTRGTASPTRTRLDVGQASGVRDDNTISRAWRGSSGNNGAIEDEARAQDAKGLEPR